jgi:hypothetical protein
MYLRTFQYRSDKMSSQRVIGVCALLVAPCLLLAWSAVAADGAGQTIGTTGGYGATGAPPPPARPASRTTTATGQTGVGIGEAPVVQSFQPAYGSRTTGRATTVLGEFADPLADVTDLSQATAGELNGSDGVLEWQTQRLAKQYANAEDQQTKAELKGELAELIQRHFDVKHEIRKREIDDLEARVTELREHLQRRQDARQAIVDTRLGQFINTADGLGWDVDAGTGPSSGRTTTNSYATGREGSFSVFETTPSTIDSPE